MKTKAYHEMNSTEKAEFQNRITGSFKNLTIDFAKVVFHMATLGMLLKKRADEMPDYGRNSK